VQQPNVLIQTSLKNWVAGQAPLGSLTSMGKYPLSPQVCWSAWSSTMSSTMLAANSSVPLPPIRVPGGCSKIELPNALTRLTKVPVLARLSSKFRRHKPSRQQTGAGGATQRGRIGPYQGRLDRPQGGRILCEKKRGPLVYSIAKTFQHPLVMPL
jgi:hypothetical protein